MASGNKRSGITLILMSRVALDMMHLLLSRLDHISSPLGLP